MAFVQGAAGSSAVNVATAAYPAGNTGGNCLIVAAMAEEPFGGFQTLAIEDTQGNVWIPLTSPPAEENNILPGVWICSSCKPGANTVTVTYGNPSDGYGWGTGKIAVAVTEWAGLISLDAHAVTPSTSTSTSTTSVTTSQSGDIIIGLQMIQGEEFTSPANSNGYTSDVSLIIEIAGVGNQMGFGVYDSVAGAAGEYSLTATSTGGWSYGYLYLLSFTASVALTAQTITFPAISNHPDTDAPFALAATASSGLAVSYSVVSGPATVAGSTVTLTGGDGVVTIRATQAGNGTYAAATPVSQSFTVDASLTLQTITFPAIAPQHPTDAPFTLAATASSGLPVSYAVTSGPATVSGNTVTLTGATGSVTIQATQAGNGTYAPAAAVNQTFTVATLIAQTITFPPLANGSANDPPFVLIGTASSGLFLDYAVTSGPATISGNTVTVTGIGVVTIEATQPGNGTYAPAAPVSQSFTVAQAQRGCIAFNQIKASDRTGNGNQLLTYSPVPAAATSPGTPGQVAYDAAGYWYFCYGTNQWGRIGPTGYGSAAASPPSW